MGVCKNATEVHGKYDALIQQMGNRYVRYNFRVIETGIGKHQEILVMNINGFDFNAVKRGIRGFMLPFHVFERIAALAGGLQIGVVYAHNVLLALRIHALDDLMCRYKIADSVGEKCDVVSIHCAHEFHGVEELVGYKVWRFTGAKRDHRFNHHVPSKTTRSLTPRNLGWFCWGHTVPRKRPIGKVLATLYAESTAAR